MLSSGRRTTRDPTDITVIRRKRKKHSRGDDVLLGGTIVEMGVPHEGSRKKEKEKGLQCFGECALKKGRRRRVAYGGGEKRGKKKKKKKVVGFLRETR